MLKRRLQELDDNEPPGQYQPKRQKMAQRGSLEGTLDTGKKTIYRALRVSRGFERQKLGRRQKTAKEQKDATESTRLANEVTALKNLDLAAIGEIHLYKALLKSRPISTAPAFPAWVAKRVKKSSPSLDAASANVVARLFNSNPVKTALEHILSGVHNVLGLAADDIPKRKKRLRAADYQAGIDARLLEKSGLRSIDSYVDGRQKQVSQSRTVADAVISNDANVSSEGDSEDYDNYQERLAKASDDESETLSESVPDGDSAAEPQGVPVDKPPLEKHIRPEILSPSTSQTPSIDSSPENLPPPIARKDFPPKSTRATTFLPTLSGGYWSGSEGSDGEAFEEDMLAVKPRKNRRGQQERRAIWEKKFGAGAKHLQNGTAKSWRDEGWDPRRGASEGRGDRAGRARGGRLKAAGGRKNGGTFRSGANGDPVSGSRQHAAGVRQKVTGKEDEGPLHPSWEAKKRAKEKEGNTAVAFQGKKLVFD